jgi:hypothetical protein
MLQADLGLIAMKSMNRASAIVPALYVFALRMPGSF